MSQFLKREFAYSEKMAERDAKYPSRLAAIEDGQAHQLADKGRYDDYSTDLASMSDANLITSRLSTKRKPPPQGKLAYAGVHDYDDFHAPTIDIDCVVHAVPSRTAGHTHLYIEKPMAWSVYVDLLKALVDAGIVERGFYAASKARKFSALRVGPYLDYIEYSEEDLREKRRELQDMVDELDQVLDGAA